MALASKSFADLITFTRASSGGRFNAAGVFEMVAANLPRLDFDPVTLQAKGLLIEEGRTNLLPYSSGFTTGWTATSCAISASGVVAPDGSMGAAFLLPTGSTSHYIASAFIPISDSSLYAGSVFLKPGGYSQANLWLTDSTGGYTQTRVDLIAGTVLSGNAATITKLSNGWSRVTIVRTPGATATTQRLLIYALSNGSTAFVADGTSGLHLWHAQMEAGSFSTSPIPTTGVAAARAADIATVNALSPWFNPDEGTLFADFDALTTPAVSAPLVVMVGAGISEICVRHDPANEVYEVINDGVALASISAGGALVSGASRKVAAAYKTGDFAFSVSGGITEQNTPGALPTVIDMRLGHQPFNSNKFNGHIRSVRYYPRRLTNAELQVMTA